MSELEHLLAMMFPGDSSGWPEFCACCSGFVDTLEPEIRAPLEKQLSSRSLTLGTNDSLSGIIDEMRSRLPREWAKFEELAVREYFSSDYFLSHFRKSHES